MMAQTIPFPTPASVKALPLAAGIVAVFAAVPDDKVLKIINSVAALFGSPEVLRHSQRNEAVEYGAAHRLYQQLAAQGAFGGGAAGGGGAGAVSSHKLDGVGSISYANPTLDPEQQADWLLVWSPWLTELTAILDSFPPGIITAQWPVSGVPA